MKAKKIAISLVVILTIFLAGFFLYKYLFTPKMFVGGTEYSPGDNGRVFVQVLSDSFTPVNNAICTIDMLYPNNSYFVRDSAMQDLGVKGLYYFDFICPDALGVYMVSVSCVYPNNKTTYYPTTASSDWRCIAFKGSGWDWGDYQQPNEENYNYIYWDDDYYYYCREGSTLYINFTDSPDGYPFVWRGRFVLLKNTTGYVYVWNSCNNQWELSGKIFYWTPDVSRYYENGTCYEPYFKIEGGKYKLNSFTLTVFKPSSTIINNIRGGGEVHIKLLKAEAEVNVSKLPPSVKVIS